MTPLALSLAVYACGTVADTAKFLLKRRDKRADLRRCWREWDANRAGEFECHGVTIKRRDEGDGDDE